MKRIVPITMLMLLLMAMFSLTLNIKSTKAEWTGTVYIRADGSIDPPDAPIVTYDYVTYTLTGDIRSNADGIIVQRDNIIIDGDGHVIQGAGSGKGIDLTDRKGIKIQNLEIITFSYGIYLYRFSKNNTIVANNLIKNSYGIVIEADDNNVVSNIITASNVTGIWIVALSDHNNITGNYVTNSRNGIVIEGSYNNRIFGNSITKNICGIDLYGSYSFNNVIYSNNITNNNYGISSWGSASYNIIYHNNFIDNRVQADSYGSVNVWDDGFPSGGNYWSDYAGIDLYSGPYQNETGSDGMGDTPYVIDANNVDRYPLMAPFKVFEAQHWDGLTYNFHVISNSTILNFELFESLIPEIPSKISLNVSGPDNTNGFCRITIPNIIVQDLWQNNYMVLLNGEPCPFKNWTDSENTYIYINYTHSTHEIVIIPEYPSTIILTIFMLTTTVLAVLTRNRRLKHRVRYML
jgi:parallel beta-helix repeat protein